MFDIPEGSAGTQHADARTGKDTCRIKQTLVYRGSKMYTQSQKTEFQSFFCTTSLLNEIYRMTIEYVDSG